MRNSGKVALLGAIVAALALAGVLPAGAQSGTKTPQATEVGVTADEIHIAVIADVDNAIAPNLFKGAVDGVEGAAKYINSKAGGGGIAGRKVVVDFYDSKLNPTESRNAIINACANDLATVGSETVFLTNVSDGIACVDKAGKATGLPDIPAISTGVTSACSPMATPVNPPQLLCDTVTANPQTYQGNQGASKYLLRTHKDGLHGAFISGSDSKDAQRGGEVLGLVQQQAGIKADQVTARSGRDPQSAYTPIVQQMKNDGSNYGYSAMNLAGMSSFRSEAQLQGISDADMVWNCTTSCYDAKGMANAGGVMEGQYVELAFLPFDETGANKMLANFVKYVGKDNISAFALYAFNATLAFREAAQRATKDGVNDLTRASLLTELKGLTAWDADGMVGTTDLANRVATSCFVLVQWRDGAFHRVYPTKKGTFDCKKSNHVELEANLLGL